MPPAPPTAVPVWPTRLGWRPAQGASAVEPPLNVSDREVHKVVVRQLGMNTLTQRLGGARPHETEGARRRDDGEALDLAHLSLVLKVVDNCGEEEFFGAFVLVDDLERAARGIGRPEDPPRRVGSGLAPARHIVVGPDL